jgi:hypothetical protein
MRLTSPAISAHLRQLAAQAARPAPPSRLGAHPALDPLFAERGAARTCLYQTLADLARDLRAVGARSRRARRRDPGLPPLAVRRGAGRVEPRRSGVPGGLTSLAFGSLRTAFDRSAPARSGCC